jgi:hypothetical protein
VAVAVVAVVVERLQRGARAIVLAHRGPRCAIASASPGRPNHCAPSPAAQPGGVPCAPCASRAGRRRRRQSRPSGGTVKVVEGRRGAFREIHDDESCERGRGWSVR